MSQFALHPLSSILLCCTTLTDFVLLILKCEMPFLLINMLDLFVHGRPCVSCIPYFVLFQNELYMFLGHSCLSLLIKGSIYYIGDTCNLLQAVVHPLLGLGICSIFFQEENFDILAFSLCHCKYWHRQSCPNVLMHIYQLQLPCLLQFLHDKNLVNRPCLLQSLQCEYELLHILVQTQHSPNSVQSQEPFLRLLPWKI